MVVSTTLTANSAMTHSTKGLVDGGAHTFGATGHRQAAITADEPGDQAEGAALTMEVTTSGRPVISVSVDT